MTTNAQCRIRSRLRSAASSELSSRPRPPSGGAASAAGPRPTLPRVHRHREAALGRSAKPSLGHRLELAERTLVELGQLAELSRVAALLQPCHGLAHLADRPALERKVGGFDDGLVTDVEGAQARLP